ncbi:predicted protein [Chaetomium globosum CBS 148.51]|uniref:Uncharacterized protein n=1 Tax=Chaetomium globosum (strain ATCC 6205 / CBS 148.51 / DSM 1962 / NBRC 6347 / NRRL 1970) TaxID=306901 RepID=Q2H4G0_CHAGB|nr:uncharacterized protein CHGG_06455 [Chaetomium globosum CBS 148.51]EAQ89836.1 predicted protein [Chaetomium globosum CBS 148.51]
MGPDSQAIHDFMGCNQDLRRHDADWQSSGVPWMPGGRRKNLMCEFPPGNSRPSFQVLDVTSSACACLKQGLLRQAGKELARKARRLAGDIAPAAARPDPKSPAPDHFRLLPCVLLTNRASAANNPAKQKDPGRWLGCNAARGTE